MRGGEGGTAVAAIDVGTATTGGGGGGATAFDASSSKPTASVRMSASGGRDTSADTSGWAIVTSTWLKPAAADAKSLRSNAAFACAYFCWMIVGSIRRRTSVNIARTRGATSPSPGWYVGSAATTAS